MANLTVNKSGNPAEMGDNKPWEGVQDYHDARREFKPQYPRPEWKAETVRAGALVAVLAVAWLIFGTWKSLYCWNAVNWQRCDGINNAEPLAMGLSALLLIGLSSWRVWVWGAIELRIGLAWAARTATTYNDWGTPVRVDLMRDVEYQPARFAQRVALKEVTSPNEIWGATNSWSPSITMTAPKASEAAPALPAPLDLVAPGTWLAWADAQPHIILAAETGGGKSTTAKSILAARIASGSEVFVIDPHSSRWFDLPGVGGGENWPEVQAALEAIGEEYRARMQERERYYRETKREMAVDAFRPLTVLLDEAYLARRQLDRKRRGQDSTPWQEFAQVMGSGARKLNIRLLLLTQSANVEDLGLSGPMRENFLRIALDSAAGRKLINAEESNPQRRAALHAAIEGRDWPAVCEWKGQLYPLDRTGLDRFTEPSDTQYAAWQGWQYEGAPVAPADDARRAALEKLRERAAEMDDRERAALAFKLRHQKWTIREIRYVVGSSTKRANDWANGKAAA